MKSVSRVRLFATPWTTRLLHPWDSPGKNTGVGCHFLLQEIFPTQELNRGLPRCRQTLLPSEPPGKCGFLNEQCREIKGNNRMAKTRCLFRASGFPSGSAVKNPLIFSAICKAETTQFGFLHFFFLGMVWSPSPVQCYEPPSIVLQTLYQI